MYTNINGCKIYYEVHGKDNGEAIFFIHGGPGMGDCRGDVETFASLAEKYKLVFLDMRGSGRSADVPPYTHEQWTADIDQLRDFLGLEKINIHGSSYGGFLSLEYTIRYPQRVNKTCLNVTAASNKHHYLAVENALNSELPGINPEMLERLFGGEVASDQEFKEMYRAIQPLYVMNWDQEKADERLNSIYFHYETHNAAFKECMAKYDLEDKLSMIETPVLVTGGRHDWITPAIYSEEMAEAIPNAQLKIFEENGHALVREKSEVYKELIKGFL